MFTVNFLKQTLKISITFLILITLFTCHKETTEPKPVEEWRQLITVGIANRYYEEGGFGIWYDVEIKDYVINPVCKEIIWKDRREGNIHIVENWEHIYTTEKWHGYLVLRMTSADYRTHLEEFYGK